MSWNVGGCEPAHPVVAFAAKVSVDMVLLVWFRWSLLAYLKTVGRRAPYSSKPKSGTGQYTSTPLPVTELAGTAPKYRESCELVRLSPITQI